MRPAASASVPLTPIKLVVRCFLEKKNDQWQAFSVELGLAAQADTMDQAKAKLESMIDCYIRDAMGIDRAHARELLSRKAPLSVVLKYKLYSFISKFDSGRNGHSGKVFDESMPLTLSGCAI